MRARGGVLMLTAETRRKGGKRERWVYSTYKSCRNGDTQKLLVSRR